MYWYIALKFIKGGTTDMQNTKYEFTKSIVLCKTTLYRIRAIRDCGNGKSGELGGYVEKEENRSQHGNCWLYDNARVYGDAWVSD